MGWGRWQGTERVDLPPYATIASAIRVPSRINPGENFSPILLKVAIMSKTQVLSLQQFAHKLGEATRMVQSASEPFHRHYVSLDEAGRKAMRVEWIQAHLEGQGYTPAQAESIMGASRKDRHAEDQKGYDRARADFTYHVVRDATNQKAEAVEVEIPEELLKAAKRLAELANAYEDSRRLASKALAMAFAK